MCSTKIKLEPDGTEVELVPGFRVNVLRKAKMQLCRIMRHLVIKLELLAPGEVFCISRHLARSLVKHSELLIKIQNVNIVRQKFLFENGPSKQIMNIFGRRAWL